MHNTEADQIKENGWLQGSVLPSSLVELLIEKNCLPRGDRKRISALCKWFSSFLIVPRYVTRSLSKLGKAPKRKSTIIIDKSSFDSTPNASEGEFYVVVSHDCDVTNASLEIEPSVELLRAEILTTNEKEGSWAWGKNPRHYHLDWDSPNGRRVCQFSIHDRFIVPRKYLALAGPNRDIIFHSDDIRALTLWLARRYVRSAFPDTFVDRTKSAAKSLRKSLKCHGDLLTAIFASVDDMELPDDSPYRIILLGSMRVDDYITPERREKAQELLDKVEAALGDCDGVEVLESHLKSEAEISLDDRRKLKRWDFDDLTIRGQPLSNLPPID